MQEFNRRGTVSSFCPDVGDRLQPRAPLHEFISLGAAESVAVRPVAEEVSRVEDIVALQAVQRAAEQRRLQHLTLTANVKPYKRNHML